jgi:hypothetical protein
MSDLIKEVERLEKLAEALESGEFKQAQGALKVEDTYCCLGVACELYHRATGLGQWTPGQTTLGSRYSFELSEEREFSVLPPVVADWYGIATNPRLNIDGKSTAATYWNDTYKADFKKIAEGFRARAAEKREGLVSSSNRNL